MPTSGSTWHTTLLVTALAALGSGCFLTHGLGPEPDPGPTPTERPPIPRPGPGPIPPDPDAGPEDAGEPDAGSPPDADLDAGDACATLFDALRSGVEIGCDGRTFDSSCALEISPCCTVHAICDVFPGDGGRVIASLSCDDSCDQHCGVYDRDGCAFAGCEWFDPGACGPAPDGVIEGPVCINPRGAACSAEAECALGQTCRTYWIDPCAGAPCAACGAEVQHCAW